MIFWRHTTRTVRSLRVCYFDVRIQVTHSQSHIAIFMLRILHALAAHKHKHTCMRYESAPVQTIKWTIKLDLRGYKWPFILHPLCASHALFSHPLALSVCASFFVDDRTLSAASKIYIYLFVSVCVAKPCTFRKCWKTGRHKSMRRVA